MHATQGHWQLAWNTASSAERPSASMDTDEAAWVKAARAGDREAFEQLVKRHQHRVFRLAGRFFRRREEIEDAAQETFLTVWRKLDTYRARAPFEHWLTRVCLNCCYARLRKRRPEEPLAPEAMAQETAVDPSLQIDTERLLAALDPKDRFVLQLLYGEGWSVAEISEKLGWSQAKVKVRAYRARKKLRRILTRKESRP